MARISIIAERRSALIALTLAGLAWGMTVPMSAVALHWLAPAWLVSLRFGVAAVLLALGARDGLRAALRPRIAAWGALGYGGMVLTQNLGIGLTSVSHVALLGGVVPALVVGLAMLRGAPRPSGAVAVGLAGAVGGVALTAGGGGGHSSIAGDSLVLLSSVLASLYILFQPPLLEGRSPVAVTAVQMGAASLAAVPIALLTEPLPGAPPAPGAVAVAGLVVLGSLLPYTLYAWGRARVSDEVAGAFFNVECLVGGLVGVVAFHDVLGLTQSLGMGLMLGGILLVASRSPEHSARPSPTRGRIPALGGEGQLQVGSVERRPGHITAVGRRRRARVPSATRR